MLEKLEPEMGENRSGELRLEVAEAKAERIIREEPKRLGWKERNLIVGRKIDAGKLAIAGRLRRETTLTIGKIAQRLHLGSSKSANARIHEWMRAQAKESVNENLNQPGEKTMLWSDSFTFRLHELFQIGLPFDGELHSRRR